MRWAYLLSFAATDFRLVSALCPVMPSVFRTTCASSSLQALNAPGCQAPLLSPESEQ